MTIQHRTPCAIACEEAPARLERARAAAERANLAHDTLQAAFDAAQANSQSLTTLRPALARARADAVSADYVLVSARYGLDPMYQGEGERITWPDRESDARALCARCPRKTFRGCLEGAVDRNERYGIWASYNMENDDERRVAAHRVALLRRADAGALDLIRELVVTWSTTNGDLAHLSAASGVRLADLRAVASGRRPGLHGANLSKSVEAVARAIADMRETAA